MIGNNRTDPTVESSLVPSVYVSSGNDPVMSRSSSVTLHISVELAIMRCFILRLYT